MSDFDKEAERERLREQYEEEQRKREATEHMSDLLLKGATMTDGHCEECGDPIFRYDGQEFCPTCQQPVEGASAEADAGEADSETETSPADAGDADATASPQRPAQSPSEDQVAPSTDRRREAPSTGDDQQGDRPVEPGHVEVPTVEPTGNGQTADTAETDPHTVPEARASLRQALATFSHQAAATDDPRRAREALETAREAAGALAALDDLR